MVQVAFILLFFINYYYTKEIWQKKFAYKGLNQNYDFANQIMHRVQNLYKNSTFTKKISKTAVMKYISSIYCEKLKNLNQNKNPLYIIAYEVFLQKYGLKSVSENKYNQVNFIIYYSNYTIWILFFEAIGNFIKPYLHSKNQHILSINEPHRWLSN